MQPHRPWSPLKEQVQYLSGVAFSKSSDFCFVCLHCIHDYVPTPRNGQRPGTILGMTRGQLQHVLEKRQLWAMNTAFVIVKNHKIGKSQHPNSSLTAATITGKMGSSILVVGADDIPLVNLWMKLHAFIHNHQDKNNTDMVEFPVAHFECKMKNAAQLLQDDLPTATDFQKQLEIRDKRLDGPRQEAVCPCLFLTLSEQQHSTTRPRRR